MNRQLFQGNLVRLVALEPERDDVILSHWTHDSEFMQLMASAPVRPLAPAQVRKEHESGDKEDHFHFLIQAHATELMVGFIRLQSIAWSHGFSTLEMGIGAPVERSKGYGAEALSLMLGFAFDELNLKRIGAVVPGYNQGALRFFQRYGFVVEACRRDAIHRFGRRWDVIHLGLLKREWSAIQPGDRP